MKTKKFLSLKIERHDGTFFNNPLQLSEVHLIKTIANENKSIIVKMEEVTISVFNSIFGKH